MKLFLCEKPSQAQDIGKCLGAVKRGDGFLSTGDGATIVTWAVGHLVQLAGPEAYGEEYARWTLDSLPIIPTHWKLLKNPKTSKQLGVVKSLVAKAKSVVVATDADREGEVIARELLDLFGFKGQVQRLWLSALDEASIKKALGQLKPGAETESLYHAGLARSRADWLVGMNMTRLMTVLSRDKGYRGVMNVGRVQSPTLALVVNRDREIANFVPKPYWVLNVDAANKGMAQFSASWVVPEESGDEEGRCIDRNRLLKAKQVVECTGQLSVENMETKREKKSPPLAFGLSSLQVACGKRWSMGAQEVLDIAQSLYETHKATTYPRTDCEYLPESMLTEVKTVLTRLYEADKSLGSVMKQLNLGLRSRVWNDAKITAHHGIIPTTGRVDISKMSDKEFKVYDLIRRHYLAQFLPHFEADKTVVSLRSGAEQFIASGKVVIVPGWQALFGKENSDDEQQLPALIAGEKCQVIAVTDKELKTAPPKHFTEAGLVSAMKNAARFVQDERLKKQLRETEGLGTEATRASIISGLLKKGFCTLKNKKYVVATPEGMALVDSLPLIIKDPGMTALWEQALNQIAEGDLSLNDFMSKQAQFLRQLIHSVGQKGVSLGGIKIKKCPECGRPMRKRTSKNGDFWGCTGYPECKHTENEGRPKKVRQRSKGSVSVAQHLAGLRQQIE